MHSPCEIQDRTVQPTVTIRTRSSVENLPATIGQSYGAIAQYLGEIGMQPSGMPFVIYYNMDMQDLDVEIGFPVSPTAPSQGDIRASEIPGGKAATCIHTGPYQEMASSYDALSRFIAEKGYEATGVAIEEYWNGPHEVPPEELKTRIILPLKAK